MPNYACKRNDLAFQLVFKTKAHANLQPDWLGNDFLIKGKKYFMINDAYHRPRSLFLIMTKIS